MRKISEQQQADMVVKNNNTSFLLRVTSMLFINFLVLGMVIKDKNDVPCTYTHLSITEKKLL